jgi:tRNA 2-selenouridine synthase
LSVPIRSSTDLSLDARAGFDAIIDVRSPSEYAEDHLPGAINLPVLDDAQRAEIGTLYVQTSKFLARRQGAALVARNIAAHLEGPLGAMTGSFRPLVYCWRGGQRSGAMVTVMDQVGWPVTRLEGGYRTWRQHVLAFLHETSKPLPYRLVLLDGPTGSGKTEVLALLAERGLQTLDLEGLASHRGSLFGAVATPQPTQKLFESRLVAQLESLDPSRPVVVEAESSRIGSRVLPARLWAAMKTAGRISLEAPIEDRAAYSLKAYAAVATDRQALVAILSRLPHRHGRATLARWQGLAEAGDLAPLVSALLEQHYDPAYRGSSSRSATSAWVLPSPVFEPDREAALASLETAILAIGSSPSE